MHIMTDQSVVLCAVCHKRRASHIVRSQLLCAVCALMARTAIKRGER